MKSVWLNNNQLQPNPLGKDIECDVAVIGGGIAGMSAAYHLQKAGLNTAVFEKGNLSSGSTGHSGGFLALATTYDLAEMAEKWGEEKAVRIYTSLHQTIRSIEETFNTYNLDCDFKNNGSFYIAAEKDDFPILQKEHELLKKYGYESGLYPAGDKAIPVQDNFGALRTFFDCSYDPAKFLNGLRGVISDIGGRVFTATEIRKLEEKPGHVILKDSLGHTVKSKHAVVATSGFSFSGRPDPSTIQYRCHIMVTKPVKDIREKWKGELIWDTYTLYHYLRLLDDDRILIGGEDTLFPGKNTPKEEQRKNLKLLKKLRRFFPEFDMEIDFGWTSPFSLPVDGLPSIKTSGRVSSIITDGMPFGWLLGQMARDRIIRGSSDLDALYDYGRDYGFFKNVIVKSKLIPGPFKHAILQTGLAILHVLNDIDETT